MDSDPTFLYNITIYKEFLQIFVLKAEDLMINVRSLTIQNLRYLYIKDIISVCLSVCLSDHNSEHLGRFASNLNGELSRITGMFFSLVLRL